MMSVQSLQLLHLLKKAQVKEDNSIMVLPSDLKAGLVIHNGQERETPIVDLARFKNSLLSVLCFLKEQNYIEFTEITWGNEKAYNLTVTHKGWHNWQARIVKITDFLISSIIVPIVVAIITAFITAIITVNVAG